MAIRLVLLLVAFVYLTNGCGEFKWNEYPGKPGSCACDSNAATFTSPITSHIGACAGFPKSWAEQNQTYRNALSDALNLMKSEAEKGITKATFFNSFFLRATKIAYDADDNNLKAFATKMTQQDPSVEKADVGRILFTSVKFLLSVLPRLGPEVSIITSIIDSSLSISTDLGGQSSNTVDWRDFIAAKFLNFEDAKLKLEHGLLKYIDEFYAHHGIGNIVHVHDAKYSLLESLIKASFNGLRPSSESLSKLLAEYMVSVKAGIVVGGCSKFSRYQWTVSRVQNPQAFGELLMLANDNCFNPKYHLKTVRGVKVKQAVLGCNFRQFPATDDYGVVVGLSKDENLSCDDKTLVGHFDLCNSGLFKTSDVTFNY